MKLPKRYNPHEYEPTVYKKWEEAGVFAPNGGKLFDHAQRKPFVIMLPLPNVTGSLHMGHALQHSLSDVLIRYHRMKGEPALWQPGTDHAGIATQNVVERELRQKGITRHDLGREKFLEQVWQWKEKYGNEIVQQMKRMGASCDWSRFVFTMDEKYVAAVHEAFIRYYKRGYIYRGNRIVNWCPRCASVISDLEIKHEERMGKLYTLRYPIKGDGTYIEVATTRPETILGDTAVAVHPEGTHAGLVGKVAVLPLMDREIPIIEDERVDISFGTGAVKVTPAHDTLDADIGKTHNLPAINVIGEDGTMTKEAGTYAGLSIQEARERILNGMKAKDLFVREEDHKHSLVLCDRCGTSIEPLLSRQWFMDMNQVKKETTEVAEKEIVKFFSPRWKKHFLEWMEGVQDWTISRQLWWGQPIPVWWKQGTRGTDHEEGNYVVSVTEPAGSMAGSAGRATWEHDPDVLDTWFSSAIWPLATLGWPQHTRDLQLLYPTSMLATAREILYLWVARMIFSGLELLKGEEYGNRTVEQRIPFHDVLIHATVLTKDGKRMSKSLGTGIDPMDLVTKYGADATRFGLLYQMSYGAQAVRFDEAAIMSARNFANKVWNIARLIESLPERDERTIADDWIEQKIQVVAQDVSRMLEEYRIGEAARTLYDFAWKDFADWYVEIAKVEGSTRIAKEVFEQFLVLLHPFMPHITEALWEQLGHKDMIIVYPWPEGNGKHLDKAVLDPMDYFQKAVSSVRSARALLEISPKGTVEVYGEQHLPLREAFEVLTKSTAVSSKRKDMKKFPMLSGSSIFVGSPEITQERLRRVITKLEQEKKQLQQFIQSQERIVDAMQRKASQKSIEEKKEIIQQSRDHLVEINQSIEILSK